MTWPEGVERPHIEWDGPEHPPRLASDRLPADLIPKPNRWPLLAYGIGAVVMVGVAIFLGWWAVASTAT